MPACQIAPTGQLKLKISQRRHRRGSENEMSVTPLGPNNNEFFLQAGFKKILIHRKG
jgi:hypothetical protein